MILSPSMAGASLTIEKFPARNSWINCVARRGLIPVRQYRAENRLPTEGAYDRAENRRQGQKSSKHCSEALEVESCESAHQTEPECETHKHLRRTELMWDWGPRLLHDRSLAIGRRIPVLLADQPKLSQQTASPGRGRTRGTVLAALALEAVTRRASRSAVRIASGMTS